MLETIKKTIKSTVPCHGKENNKDTTKRVKMLSKRNIKPVMEFLDAEYARSIMVYDIVSSSLNQNAPG